ncbi:MAG: pseudouridine synthase [Bacteroidota bacterium]
MNTMKNSKGRSGKGKTTDASKSRTSPFKKDSGAKELKAKDAKGDKKSTDKKPFEKKTSDSKDVTARDKRKYIEYRQKVKKGDPMPTFNEDAIRLNKYLSNAGVCSRREADVLIETGVVSVNGEIVTEMGYKIKPGDVIRYDEQTINAEKKQYVLLNKPKGFITTMDDPLGRKTVMSLVKKACKERIYPVGRLDRDTTGLLLFTNDGDMVKKLTHPRQRSTKIYHVELDKHFSQTDLTKLLNGVALEDGTTSVEKVEYVKSSNHYEVGVEINSGKNKIVRRLFEALGYKIVKLDRVTFAGLNKKDLPRGYYRHLTEKEIAFLKMS